MKPMTCEQCLWWEMSKDHGGNEIFRNGRCRRYPPQNSMWPSTRPDDWCGEFIHNSDPNVVEQPVPLDQNVHEVVVEEAQEVRH